MGYRLVNEVLDYAPADLGSSERLLLVALAAYVTNETARECFPGQASILRRTGLTAGGLKKVFQRLAERGLDPRVILRTDKNGKPVYAYEGARTRYRIPVFAAPSATSEGGQEYPHSGNNADPQRGDASIPTSSQEGGLQDPHSAPRGDTPVPQRGSARPLEGVRAYPPKEKKEKKEHPRPPLQTEPHQSASSPTTGATETTGDHDDPSSSASASGQPEDEPMPPTPRRDAAAFVAVAADRYLFPAAAHPDLADAITAALMAGWTLKALEPQLTARLDGVHDVAAVWLWRLDPNHPERLGPTPVTPTPTRGPWCGQCDHPDTRWRETEDGTLERCECSGTTTPTAQPQCPDCGRFHDGTTGSLCAACIRTSVTA